MSSTPSEQHPRRRSAALAIAAGLLGGGAVGLVATMPNAISAASPSTTAAPATSAPNDDSATDDATADDTGSDTGKGDRGAHIREELQPLVDDGTIDAGQADAVADHLATSRPGKGEGRGPGGRPGGAEMKQNADEFAQVLGLADAAELRAEFEAGKSIAQIAADNGVAIDTVKDYMVAQLDERLDAAVADGKIDQATADEKRAEAEQMIDEKINSTDGGFGRPGGRRGPKAGNGRTGENQGSGPNIVDNASA